jgi:hypothetical protein
MGRRTSGQQVGLQAIGNVQANANTLTTTQTNQNLSLDPNGTGTVEIGASVNITGDVSIANQGDLRLLEATANGTNYIAQQAAANMAANYTITWPAAVSGTTGFVLTSDTSGNLSWASAGGNIPVSDSGSTATVHYPFFGTASGSLPTSLSPLARSNLSFVPSTGILTSTGGFVGSTHDGSTANSGTVTIRGTSSATKAAASVLMTDAVASSSSTTGTLVVTGGVGISGALNVGGAAASVGFTSTGKIQITNASASTLTDSSANFEVQDNGGTSRPTISFHRPGVFASKITFNTDNAYYFGGWSAGAGASPIVCGGVNPGANNTYDLGTSSLRWRTIFTQDLELSNGIGDFTIVEGEDDLFIYNNKKGKVYKFALIEVDPTEATPKIADLKKE